MDIIAIVATGVFLLVVAIGQTLMAWIMKVPFETEARDLGRSWAYRAIGGLALGGYLVGLGPTAHWVPSYVRFMGIWLIAGGMFLIFWAQYTLGRNWVGGIGLHPGHKLVVNGPYAYVRHPIYSGYCLAALGITIASVNLLAISGSWMTCCALLVRIFSEEQLMKKRFKNRYVEYCQQTGWLIPRMRGRLWP